MGPQPRAKCESRVGGAAAAGKADALVELTVVIVVGDAAAAAAAAAATARSARDPVPLQPPRIVLILPPDDERRNVPAQTPPPPPPMWVPMGLVWSHRRAANLRSLPFLGDAAPRVVRVLLVRQEPEAMSILLWTVRKRTLYFFYNMPPFSKTY